VYTTTKLLIFVVSRQHDVHETVSICSNYSGTAGLPPFSVSHSDNRVLTPWWRLARMS